MEPLTTDIKLLAFYEIARRANLTGNNDLLSLPAFQAASKLYEQRSEYMRQAFGSPQAIDDFVKLHIEGILATENKTWEDIWSEFAPASLRIFPLPAGTL